MQRPHLGDVVEVPTSKGYFYGLVTHHHDWGDVARFWKEPYPSRPDVLPDFEKVGHLITTWIHIGSARVGLKNEPGADFIGTGYESSNPTSTKCPTAT